MRKLVPFTLLYLLFSFLGNTQGIFRLSDTMFCIGQKCRLTDIPYPLGGKHHLFMDTLISIQLDSVVLFLQQNKNVSVEIGVHTDCRGNDTMNLKLTQRHSEYVKYFLVKRCVPESQIVAKGYGETEWIISEEEINKYRKTNKAHYEKLHVINRRTELKIIGI
ncbi:OmpA family protein [Fluviicola taffensis]|nr:OmpA family protein [Fluviicola taffensis]